MWVSLAGAPPVALSPRPADFGSTGGKNGGMDWVPRYEGKVCQATLERPCGDHLRAGRWQPHCPCGPASTQETEAEAWVRCLSSAEQKSASKALRHMLAEIQ